MTNFNFTFVRTPIFDNEYDGEYEMHEQRRAQFTTEDWIPDQPDEEWLLDDDLA